MPITIDFMGSTPAQGLEYNNHVMKFVRLAAGEWFSLGLPVSSTNKTDLHDITEILLKVSCNTIK